MVKALISCNFLHKLFATNVTLFNAPMSTTNKRLLQANIRALLLRSVESWVGIQNIMGYVLIADRKTLVSTWSQTIAEDRTWFYPLQSSIYALGTAFSCNRNLCEIENFTSKINKLQKLFNIWSQRDLSLYGRKFSAKTLGLLKLMYSSTCVQTAAQVSHIFNKLVVNFIWNGKNEN